MYLGKSVCCPAVRMCDSARETNTQSDEKLKKGNEAGRRKTKRVFVDHQIA